MECGLRRRQCGLHCGTDRRAKVNYRSMPDSTASTPPPGGIVDSIRSFLASWVAMIKTRVEIVSVELEEQREWIEQLMLLALAALFCLSLGLILLTLLIVVLFWDSHPLWVLGGFAFLYLGAG